MKARGPGQSALLLVDVAGMLTKQGIDYAVIGALAAAVHGSMRATTDADALLAITISRLAKLKKVFRDAGVETDLRRGDSDDPIPAILAITDTHGNRVELLSGLRGLDPEAFTRRIRVKFHGAALRFIGREDFIAMKCYAGRPQDIADARLALTIRDQPIDIDLLRRLARRFGRPAADSLEKLLTDS